MTRLVLSSVLVCLSLASARAADLKMLPGDIVLHGAGSRQRLLVVQQQQQQVIADRTARATFSSANPAIARVDAKGQVQAVANGETTVQASCDGAISSVKVRVVGVSGQPVPSFRNEVQAVLTRHGCNSGACHGALAGKGGMKLSLRGYDPEADYQVLTRQALGRRVDRLDPARSLLLTKPTFAVPHGGGRKLEVDSLDFQVLADWIVSGAPGPKADDPGITRLEVFPAEASLRPSDQVQVVVRAHYADASVRDVTPWAKFISSEDLVASVDSDGLVKVSGHGEAAISVLFDNRVAAFRVISPLANKVDPAVFTGATRVNFVDDLVLKKLQSLRIPPSPPCTDTEFIRRVYLDCLGILPTPTEVQSFLADKTTDKREKLIDQLLTRPEYVDYWTHKWCDLLLVSTRKLPQPSVWSFYQSIRQAVADNRPWDQFARQLLTAQGSTFDNGLANYFALHRDISDLTEATAVTFMGMSITCARCHNHPLEKWTQDQYWGMANLFARVGLKNGERGGEVIVQSQREGEAMHPRRGVGLPPTPLDGEALPLDAVRDRRTHFASWLTAADNPFFARALVNRVWRNFMARGLVEAEDDFRQTNPPSNAELLDALSADFVKNQYDVRKLIRTITTSATYQRSSRPVPGNETDDRYGSRYVIRRLTAEVILDAYAQVTDVPTPFTQVNVGSSGGTADTAMYPRGTRALQLPDSLLVSPFLDAFGRPDRSQTCSCERQQDSSIGQALHLNNGKTLNDKLSDKKSRVEQWVEEKITDAQAIERVFLLALNRAPTEQENRRFLALLSESARDSTRRQSLEDLFWAVLTSREFVFNH